MFEKLFNFDREVKMNKNLAIINDILCLLIDEVKHLRKALDSCGELNGTCGKESDDEEALANKCRSNREALTKQLEPINVEL